MKLDREILTMALQMCEVQKEKLDNQIEYLKTALGGHTRVPKRQLSAAARKRIGDAARRRWATQRAATTKRPRKRQPKPVLVEEPKGD